MNDEPADPPRWLMLTLPLLAGMAIGAGLAGDMRLAWIAAGVYAVVAVADVLDHSRGYVRGSEN